jgi:protease IV
MTQPPPLPPPDYSAFQAPLPTPPPRRGRRVGLWIVLIFSLLLNLLFFGGLFIRVAGSSEVQPASVFKERFLEGSRNSKNKIAVIRVEGVISSSIEGHVGYDGMVGDIKEQLRLAVNDPHVRAIILRVDSPGGEVLASDTIYRAVKEADGRKPILCSMGSVAASGGYYAAMGARHVMANELTITGSIGVIMQTLNYSEMIGKIGLKTLTFKSGKFKDILNGSRDPLPEEIDLVQGLVMETYDQFLQVVAKERKLDANAIREGIADGRIFSGKQALDLKLIDSVGDFQDAIEEARNLGGIARDGYIVFDYVVPFSFGNLFGMFAKSTPGKLQIQLTPENLPIQSGKLYYLSLHLF